VKLAVHSKAVAPRKEARLSHLQGSPKERSEELKFWIMRSGCGDSMGMGSCSILLMIVGMAMKPRRAER